MADPRLRALLTVGLLAGSALLLVANHLAWRGGTLAGMEGSRRLWEDFTVAQTDFHASPGAPRQSINDDARLGARMRQFIPRLVREEDIQPWEFWRTVRVPVRFREPALELRETDDHGRSELMFSAFRLIGGVAPMMMLWAGLLAGFPIVAWLTAELIAAGRLVAAAVVALGLASSPFFVLALSLPYAPMGFYLLGLICLMALSVSAFMGPDSGRASFAARAALAGILFVLLLRCRSSVVFLAPAFTITILGGMWRRTKTAPSGARRRWMAASLTLLFLPWLLLRPTGHHEVFLGLWEGLGDFDRTRGHHWNDPVAKDFLEANGRGIPRTKPIWLYNNEDLFRKAFLADVTGDPAWYAAILGKRAISSLGLTRLWTGRLRALEPSETTIGVYWAMTPPVHRLRLGDRALDIWPPLLILFAGFAAARRPSADGSLLAVCVTGALALPVFFTTASGVETQGLGLVYLLGSALALDRGPKV